ncbi:MAG: SDR family NAD(P)-dependent oxidoreductase [Candidatus Saccharimonas sp.]
MSQERTVSYVLITGTTSGLGREFARLFAQNGYNIAAVARNEVLLQQQKQELESQFGIEMVYVVKDLSAENSAQEVYDEIKHKGINIDILINNAGFGSFGRYVDVDWQRQKGLASVNMLAVMQLSYLFGKDMDRRGEGKIVNIASIASFQAGPYMAMYYASKAFVRSFSEALHEEMKSSGVSVTAICPGPVATNFEKNAQMINSAMFTRLRVYTPEVVAARSYRAIMNNKAVYVVGWPNKLLVFLTRFCSLKFSRVLASKINLGSGRK